MTTETRISGSEQAGLLARLIERRRCRRAEEAMRALDDHLLRDIGLTRSMIAAAAWRGREGRAPRRSIRPAMATRFVPRRPAAAAILGTCIGAGVATTGAEGVQSLPTVEDLPPGTIQVSPFIAGMGEHWADPRDLPLGPIYCVMQGRVVCAEFMVAQQDLVDGKSFEALKLGLADSMPPVDHVELTYMPSGHEGYETPHYDFHMYFIPLEERFAREEPPSP